MSSRMSSSNKSAEATLSGLLLDANARYQELETKYRTLAKKTQRTSSRILDFKIREFLFGLSIETHHGEKC